MLIRDSRRPASRSRRITTGGTPSTSRDRPGSIQRLPRLPGISCHCEHTARPGNRPPHAACRLCLPGCALGRDRRAVHISYLRVVSSPRRERVVDGRLTLGPGQASEFGRWAARRRTDRRRCGQPRCGALFVRVGLGRGGRPSTAGWASARTKLARGSGHLYLMAASSVVLRIWHVRRVPERG